MNRANLEEKVLGTLISHYKRISEQIKITHEMFSSAKHKTIMSDLQNMISREIVINPTTIKSFIGDKVDEETLVNVVSAVQPYEIFNELQRQLFGEYRNTKISDYNYQLKTGHIEFEEYLEQVNALTFELEDTKYKSSGHTTETVKKLFQVLQTRDGSITGLKTGFKELDWLLSGINPTKMIVIGARPSVGKTAFALNVANNLRIYNSDKEVITPVFSLEMPEIELLERLIGVNTQISSYKLKRAAIEFNDDDWKEVIKCLAFLDNPSLRLYDSKFNQIEKIIRELTALRRENPNAEIVTFIDYIGLLSGGDRYKGNRNMELSEISRLIKETAKSLNITIVALSQLSRDTSKQNRKPRMSDLRDSGAIEQDADVIALLHRDDYEDSEVREDKTVIECIVDKNRDGKTGTVKMLFEKEFSKMLDLPKEYQ